MPFGGEQYFLALNAASISAERAVASDHAVAGDENADVVVAIGRAYGPDRFWMTNRGSDLGVTASFPGRNSPKLAPDRLLEGRTGDVDREIGPGKGTYDRLKSPPTQS